MDECGNCSECKGTITAAVFFSFPTPPPPPPPLSSPSSPSPSRRVFAMMRYNNDTHDIARPSEVLARIQSYMSALRTLELYLTIDMTRVLTAVLLQETQMLDSKGEATIASTYTTWYMLCTVVLFIFLMMQTFNFSPIPKCTVRDATCSGVCKL